MYNISLCYDEIMKKIEHLIDPAFLRDTGYSYVHCNDKELATVLSFALAKHKKDLILHQQRIELHANNEDNTLLFSAIVDLFTALEDKGITYKQRILDKYRSLLSTKQAMVLTKSLITVLAATTCIEDLQQSVLNLGIQGKILSQQDIQI